MKAVHLFVYGTLMSYFKNPFSGILVNQSSLLGSGYIHANMYDIGEYPGIVFSNNKQDKVWGEIFLIKEVATLQKLDEYEGEEYQRLPVDIFFNNSSFPGETYVFIKNTNSYPLIQGGDYKAYLQSR